MGTWKFDPLHTQVEFSAKHLGMMTVRGHFAEVAATGELYPDQPERSKVEVTINTASIRTHHAHLDDDLREDFRAEDFLPLFFFVAILSPGLVIGCEMLQGETRCVSDANYSPARRKQ